MIDRRHRKKKTNNNKYSTVLYAKNILFSRESVWMRNFLGNFIHFRMKFSFGLKKNSHFIFQFKNARKEIENFSFCFSVFIIIIITWAIWSVLILVFYYFSLEKSWLHCVYFISFYVFVLFCFSFIEFSVILFWFKNNIFFC